MNLKEYIDKKEKELYDKVHCGGCGSLKDIYYEGDLICSKQEEQEEKEQSYCNAYRCHAEKNKEYGDWGDLSQWDLLQEIKKYI